MTFPLVALQEFKKSRDMLNRALRIENDAVSNGHSSRDNASALTGTMELLALCARAAAACGDIEDAKTMAEKATSLATGSCSSSSSSIMFWVHMICGEAYLLMDAHACNASSSSRSLAVAAAAAFRSACDVVSRLQHLSAVAQLQLHVSMGKSTIITPTLYNHTHSPSL